ncbi:frizzled-5-like [Halichondria panicea]|uniref:frizzled-5-like n=1 Tax=Halichondria panicea TaxID=6063 RepID=UPI00312BC062
MRQLKLQVLLSTLLSYLSVVIGQSCNFSPNPNAQCLPVLNNVCKTVGYNMTSLPNLFNHSTQQEAEAFFNKIAPIFHTSCSVYLAHFLCSATHPICFPNQFQQIHPCRELCTAVRETCIPTLRQIGLEWPDELDCTLYSSYQDSLCVWTQANPCSTMGRSMNEDNRVIVNRVNVNCSGRLVKLQNSSNYDFGSVKHCTEPCSGVYFDQEKQEILLIWITIISLITLLVCVIIFLTFIFNYRKIPNLETPIYYIAVCYGISSLTYVISITIGKESIICNTEFKNQHNESALLTNAQDHPLCLILFCVLYYSILCTWSWWVICSLQWLITSLKSTNMSTKWKICFHIIAWCIPLVFTLTALSLGHVAGDATVKTCWIEKHYELPFLVAPLSTAVVICSVVLVVCFARVVKLQKSKKPESDIAKISALTLVRVGLYCTVYLIPMGLLLCAYFYEFWYREEWEIQYLKCVNSAASNCENSGSPVYAIFMIKIASMLSMGTVSLLWILRSDLITIWRKFCCFCTTNVPEHNIVYTPNGRYTPTFQLHHAMDYPTSSDSSV